MPNQGVILLKILIPQFHLHLPCQRNNDKLLRSFYNTQLNMNIVNLFYMIIQGTAGTGKSFLIHCISHALSTSSANGNSPLLLLAPTGIAAFNIHAKTIHSALKIPIKDMRPLQGQSLAIFQEEMRHIRYILIDEMSFLGPRLFIQIDSRLREAFPDKKIFSFWW
jgi:DNA replication protein DnaC